MWLDIAFFFPFLFFSTPSSSSLFSLIIACSLLSVIAPSHINALSFMHLPHLCAKNSFQMYMYCRWSPSLLLTITTYLLRSRIKQPFG